MMTSYLQDIQELRVAKEELETLRQQKEDSLGRLRTPCCILQSTWNTAMWHTCPLTMPDCCHLQLDVMPRRMQQPTRQSRLRTVQCKSMFKDQFSCLIASSMSYLMWGSCQNGHRPWRFVKNNWLSGKKRPRRIWRSCKRWPRSADPLAVLVFPGNKTLPCTTSDFKRTPGLCCTHSRRSAMTVARMVTLRTTSFSVSTAREFEKMRTDHAFEEPIAPEEAWKFPTKIDHRTPFFHITPSHLIVLAQPRTSPATRRTARAVRQLCAELWKHGSTEPYWDSVKMCRTSFTCCDHFVTSYRWSCLMEKRWRSLDAKYPWFVVSISIFKRPCSVSQGSHTPCCYVSAMSLFVSKPKPELRCRNRAWNSAIQNQTGSRMVPQQLEKLRVLPIKLRVVWGSQPET